MSSLLGSLIVVYILILLLPTVAICLSLPYIALRIRDSREEKKDPALGIKAAYYLLLSAAILLILFGLTIGAIDVMEGTFEKGNRQNQGPLFNKDVDKEFKERMQRVALGLVTSGVLFTLLFMILIKSGSNDLEFPAAKRLFAGGRLALAGVVNMLAITTLIILTMQKDIKNFAVYEIITGVTMVWLPTLAIHIFLMHRYGSQDYHIEKVERRSFRREVNDVDD